MIEIVGIRGRRLTAEQEQALAAALAEQYRAGASLRQVATDAGTSFGLARRLILGQGVEMRRREPRAKPPPQRRRLTVEQRRELRPVLATGYRAGATIHLLAEIHGLTYGVVHRLLKEEGVAMRPRGGAGNRLRKAILRTVEPGKRG